MFDGVLDVSCWVVSQDEVGALTEMNPKRWSSRQPQLPLPTPPIKKVQTIFEVSGESSLGQYRMHRDKVSTNADSTDMQPINSKYTVSI